MNHSAHIHTNKFHASSFFSLCVVAISLRKPICFFGGSIRANGEAIFRLGDHTIVESSNGFSAQVNLQNSRSYGRVTFVSPVLSARIDYVPPSTEWGPFSEDEAATYAHLNFAVERISLTDKAHGVLGKCEDGGKRASGCWIPKSSNRSRHDFINKIGLTPWLHCVCFAGQTKTLTYDSNGNPVMKSSEANGEGVITGTAEDYIVASIFATDFKYSNF